MKDHPDYTIAIVDSLSRSPVHAIHQNTPIPDVFTLKDQIAADTLSKMKGGEPARTKIDLLEEININPPPKIRVHINQREIKVISLSKPNFSTLFDQETNSTWEKTE